MKRRSGFPEAGGFACFYELRGDVFDGRKVEIAIGLIAAWVGGALL